MFWYIQSHSNTKTKTTKTNQEVNIWSSTKQRIPLIQCLNPAKDYQSTQNIPKNKAMFYNNYGWVSLHLTGTSILIQIVFVRRALFLHIRLINDDRIKNIERAKQMNKERSKRTLNSKFRKVCQMQLRLPVEENQ